MSSTNKETRSSAIELYKALTTYDNYLSLFFYRDVTALMARTSQLLQGKDLEIPEVGHRIMLLCERLVVMYSEDDPFPQTLVGDGHGDNLLRELFPDGFDGMFQISIYVANNSVIEDKEKELQEQLKVATPPQMQEPDSPVTTEHTTRGVNNSAKYSSIIPKCRAEEHAQSNAMIIEPVNTEVPIS